MVAISPEKTIKQVTMRASDPKQGEEFDCSHGGWKRFLELPFPDRQRMCQQWWDILQKHTLLLDAANWPSARISQALGVTRDEVVAILDPRLPEHSFTEMFRHPEEFSLHYYNAVREKTAGSMVLGYAKAGLAAEEEGFGNVATALQALQEKWQRQVEQLGGSGALLAEALRMSAEPKDKEVWPLAGELCVWEDARVALRVAPKTYSGRVFLMMFLEWCAEVRKSIEQAAARWGQPYGSARAISRN